MIILTESTKDDMKVFNGDLVLQAVSYWKDYPIYATDSNLLKSVRKTRAYEEIRNKKSI